MMNKNINIYILAGFLGSGKTTLLKNLIREEKAANRTPAVLMNEFGDVSIDSNEVEEGTPLKELLGGCICCSIQDKLESQLQEMLFQYQFDSLYIETTGAAHPVEVLDAIMSPLFADKFEFKGIITLVDGGRWSDRKSLPPQILHLMQEQIRHADLVIVNKCDQLKEMKQATAAYEMQALNPEARVLLTSQSQISLDAVQSMGRKAHMPHTNAHIYNDLHLQSMVYTFTGTVQLKEFEDWLRSLPDTVYRIKGYVPFSHSRYPYLFQFSYGMPVYMQENMKMPLNLVIIGEKIDEEHIREQLFILETV